MQMLFVRFGNNAILSFTHIAGVVFGKDHQARRTAYVHLTSGSAIAFHADSDPEVYAALEMFRDEGPDIADFIKKKAEERRARAEEEAAEEDEAVSITVGTVDVTGFTSFLESFGFGVSEQSEG